MTSTFEYNDIFEKLHDAISRHEGSSSYHVSTNFNETVIEVTLEDYSTSSYSRFQDSPAVTIKILLGKTWAVLKHKACTPGAEEDNVDLLGQSNYVISWKRSDADTNDETIVRLADEVHHYMVPPENENPTSLDKCVMLIAERVKRLERRLKI